MQLYIHIQLMYSVSIQTVYLHIPPIATEAVSFAPFFRLSYKGPAPSCKKLVNTTIYVISILEGMHGCWYTVGLELQPIPNSFLLMTYEDARHDMYLLI